MPAVGWDHAAIGRGGGIDDGKNVVALVVATPADSHRVAPRQRKCLFVRCIEGTRRAIQISARVITGRDPAIHAECRLFIDPVKPGGNEEKQRRLVPRGGADDQSKLGSIPVFAIRPMSALPPKADIAL